LSSVFYNFQQLLGCPPNTIFFTKGAASELYMFSIDDSRSPAKQNDKHDVLALFMAPCMRRVTGAGKPPV
jgi:hypothetical protein